MALAGCEIEERCYIATGVVVLQGARVGRASRLAVGSVVDAGSVLKPATRVGLHRIAVPDGDNGALITADIETARESIARAYFGRSFGLERLDQERLHKAQGAYIR